MADAKKSRKTTASKRRKIAPPRGGAGGAEKAAAKKSATKKPAAGKSDAKKSVEVVDGGRYVLIDGRRWRATDPDIPEAERVRLVGELMSARRDVGHALRAGDEEAERAARARVHAAKVALGERGERWWERGAAAKKR